MQYPRRGNTRPPFAPAVFLRLRPARVHANCPTPTRCISRPPLGAMPSCAPFCHCEHSEAISTVRLQQNGIPSHACVAKPRVAASSAAWGWQARPRGANSSIRGAIPKAFVPRRAAALRGGCHPEFRTSRGSLPEDLHRHRGPPAPSNLDRGIESNYSSAQLASSARGWMALDL
jgi:hypothetical protein